mgnify:CR=1 FL=1
MKIEELLNANNSANKADEVWNHILETAKAENKRLSLKNKDKLKINEIAIMPKELAKHLSAKLSEL